MLVLLKQGLGVGERTSPPPPPLPWGHGAGGQGNGKAGEKLVLPEVHSRAVHVTDCLFHMSLARSWSRVAKGSKAGCTVATLLSVNQWARRQIRKDRDSYLNQYQTKFRYWFGYESRSLRFLVLCPAFHCVQYACQWTLGA